MATECLIEFDNNPQGVFFGGQILSGTVNLTTRKQKTIRAIYITIDGYAKVEWQESRTRRENDRTVSYTVDYRGYDQYLLSRTYVIGTDRGDSREFVPGRYEYRFQVALPDLLPSSYDGLYGHIRYQVVVTIDRPWRFDNVFKKPFTVIYTLDLNRNPIYRSPLFVQDEKTFCCFCCSPGIITASFSVPLSGYAPGQKIPFVVLIENESTIDCRKVRIKLVQQVVFISDTPERDTRRESIRLAQKTLGAVLKLSKKELKNVLELPSIPPSSLNSCRIIEISYTLHAVIHTPGCHSNIELSVPITIGSVPLYESATNPVNIQVREPTAPELTEQGDNPPGYNTIVPPTYEEAMGTGGKNFVPKDDDGHAKVEPYVPRYPMYPNFATAPTEDDMNAGTGSDGGVSFGWKN